MKPLLLFLRVAYCALIGLIIAVALAPAVNIGLAGGDKLNHFAAFFTLASLARLLWQGAGVLLPLAGLVALGGAIEVLQGVMQLGRQADWHDMAVNVVAIATGLAVAQSVLGFYARLRGRTR